MHGRLAGIDPVHANLGAKNKYIDIVRRSLKLNCEN